MAALGIDVGGTFTDFIGVDADGRVHVHKQLTTPSDPSASVLGGTTELAERASLELKSLDRIIHGTTLVANSIIERRGARTALVTTIGFRDAVEIGREARYDLYDLNLERPEPLIPRSLRFEVDERLRGDGSVLDPLTEDEAVRIAGVLRDAEVESVAISLVNAYANPVHERMLADVLARELPDLDVTLSSTVAPQWREFERTSTASANAFVRPLVRRYLAKLEAGFEERAAGNRLYIVLSQGGMTSAGVAADLAVQLVESGPAGGVMAAAYFGRRLGLKDLISFDMGGTTTKASLVTDGSPLRVPELEVARVARFKRGSGLPLQISALELVEIGAGGGSIGRVDSLGLLRVGPQSASADPGPACYGQGGENPTVTDANVVLGILDPDYFLGGEMELKPGLAEEALARVGEQIGLDAEATARGMFDIVNSQMALALQTHVIERGEDPRAFAMFAFGGAGPVHAYEVARRLGIRTVICPPAAGVASALGFLVAPFAVDLVRTFPAKVRDIDWPQVADRFAEMETEARDLLARSGAADGTQLERRVDMRYAGQGYTVSVPLPDGPLDERVADQLRTAFAEAYEHRFGSRLSTAEPEALHWRVTALVETPDMHLEFASMSEGEARRPDRQTYFPEAGGFVTCAVYDRYALKPGETISGPALVQERESTVVVGPSGTATKDELGNLVVTIGEDR
jgi:N-methylhydantoinase A/oxoprolinase/acetone carboxylase beta subunit